MIKYGINVFFCDFYVLPNNLYVVVNNLVYGVS